jgi:predicted acylesterase/phospholipase RssA
VTKGRFRLLWPLLFLGTNGCVGAVVGTIIDTTVATVRRPVAEYVFLGAHKYDNPSGEPWRGLADDRGRDFGNELVGVAVSGGGSRSAYFLACVLDEMRSIEIPAQASAAGPTHNLLDEIDYLSSVSGGSLASAYYTLHRPSPSDPAALDAFFGDFRADMRRHFELRSVGRMVFGLRWLPLLLTYYHRGHVMASTWDANFFDDATFADLPPPPPPYPSLIVNATSYSSGQKFLFTRLPTARFDDSLVFARLREGRLIVEGFDPSHRPLRSVGFDTLDSDIGSYRISHAVVASAGVPNLLGPVVLKSQARSDDDDHFVALGDGGIYDNYGLETLLQLFTTILEERPGLRARIIVVDGSGFFEAEHEHTEYTLADYADRTATIAWLRAGAYAEPFFRSLTHLPAAEGGADSPAVSPYHNLRIQIVSLYHQTPEPESATSGALQGLQRAYDLTVRASVSAVVDFVSNLNESAKGIGTRFKLSAPDAETIEAQARVVVPAVLGPGAPAEPPPLRR